MSQEPKRDWNYSLFGIALMLGAWIGATIGVLIGGGPGVVLGSVIGAALGITCAIARSSYQDRG